MAVGTATATLKLGLYGYDISCIANTCLEASDLSGYCATLHARGIDGLAFGIHSEIFPVASANNFYCVGFRSDFGDTAACSWSGGPAFTYLAYI